jgi:hypothetical protein
MDSSPSVGGEGVPYTSWRELILERRGAFSLNLLAKGREYILLMSKTYAL